MKPKFEVTANIRVFVKNALTSAVVLLTPLAATAGEAETCSNLAPVGWLDRYYQCYHALSKVVSLSPDETIYLEGAGDLKDNQKRQQKEFRDAEAFVGVKSGHKGIYVLTSPPDKNCPDRLGPAKCYFTPFDSTGGESSATKTFSINTGPSGVSSQRDEKSYSIELISREDPDKTPVYLNVLRRRSNDKRDDIYAYLDNGTTVWISVTHRQDDRPKSYTVSSSFDDSTRKTLADKIIEKINYFEKNREPWAVMGQIDKCKSLFPDQGSDQKPNSDDAGIISALNTAQAALQSKEHKSGRPSARNPLHVDQ